MMFGQIVRKNKSCYDDLETCLKEVDEAVKNDHEMDVQPIYHDDCETTLMMASEHRQRFEEWLMKFYFKGEESKSRTAQIVTAKAYREIFSLLLTPDTDLKPAERQKK